jgi:MSHA biogenesis protein MshP
MNLQRKALRRQHGFAAIAAIFLVVILAALGGFMVTFSNTQQLTSAQDVQGTRAYWAARAGLEWGVGSVVDCANTAATCPRTTTTAPPLGCPSTPLTTILSSTFDGGFEVRVTLGCAAYFEATPAPTTTANRYIYQFTSVSTGGTVGTIGYVERSVSASLECKRNGPLDGIAYTGADPLTYTCG